MLKDAEADLANKLFMELLLLLLWDYDYYYKIYKYDLELSPLKPFMAPNVDDKSILSKGLKCDLAMQTDYLEQFWPERRKRYDGNLPCFFEIMDIIIRRKPWGAETRSKTPESNFFCSISDLLR